MNREQEANYLTMLEILYNEDPIRLACCGAPSDEYSPEAEPILLDLDKCASVSVFHKLVYDVFVRMFDEHIVGHPDNLYSTARAIYEEFCR